MSKLVAVEDGLDPVGEALSIAETDGNRFPVIEAAGKTAREVVDQVKSRGLR